MAKKAYRKPSQKQTTYWFCDLTKRIYQESESGYICQSGGCLYQSKRIYQESESAHLGIWRFVVYQSKRIYQESESRSWMRRLLNKYQSKRIYQESESFSSMYLSLSTYQSKRIYQESESDCLYFTFFCGLFNDFLCYDKRKTRKIYGNYYVIFK